MEKQSSSETQNLEVETHTVSPGEVIIGELADIDSLGRPLVSYAAMTSSDPMLAVTTQEVTPNNIGRQVALLFANGESNKPVIVGLIHNPLTDILENYSIQQQNENADTPFPEVTKEYAQITDLKRDQEEQVIVDGKRVVIEGAEEITLKCGKASITLTKSGKILIRGTYLSNRSSGVNRILGGSVQIN